MMMTSFGSCVLPPQGRLLLGSGSVRGASAAVGRRPVARSAVGCRTAGGWPATGCVTTTGWPWRRAAGYGVPGGYGVFGGTVDMASSE